MRALARVTVLAGCLLAGIGSAQEMPVPVDVQAPLFLKILSYDRGLRARVGRELVIGIVFQQRWRASERVKDELTAAAAGAVVFDGTPVRFQPLDVSSRGLESQSLVDVDVLYVAPLRGVALASIADITREKKIPSFSGVPEYVASGLGVGIDLHADKPRILVNLVAAKAEGCDFHPQLLKLARLVDGREAP